MSVKLTRYAGARCSVTPEGRPATARRLRSGLDQDSRHEMAEV